MPCPIHAHTSGFAVVVSSLCRELKNKKDTTFLTAIGTATKKNASIFESLMNIAIKQAAFLSHVRGLVNFLKCSRVHKLKLANILN